MRARTGFRLLIVFLTFQLAGCALMRTGRRIKPPASIPSIAAVDAVPFFTQREYQCGPAALAMVLQWSGISITPADLVPEVYTPARKGSLQAGLVSAARRHDRLAYPIRGLPCLAREVAAGHPVIVLQNLALNWWPRWHYAVVIGYDYDSQLVVEHSADTPSRSVGMRTFLNTWQRAELWGLCVLPPGEMPVCADESDYLKAALGLQQAGDLKGAVEAFRAAVERWPHSVEACLALGNALYTNGLLPEAIRTLSRAVQLDPANGPALNNLAHVLAASGDLQAAEVMARRAVAAGGAYLDVYRRTLDEIIVKKNPGISD